MPNSNSNKLMDRFLGGAAGGLVYLADLTLWYPWHRERGTLPDGWKNDTLPEIARKLGSLLWWAVRPWRLETPGVEVESTEQESQRVVRYHTEAGILTARWSLGPDGDWWQTEYPVKSAQDLPAARQLVNAHSYSLNVAEWERWQSDLGGESVLALELPQSPYSNLLHTLLGWSEGLMLLMGDERESILEMLDVMSAKYRALVAEIAHLPGGVVLAPDNLDGQFISPSAFRQHMADSYRQAAETLHAQGERLVVHVGGMCRHLLAPLAAAGVDGVEGVAGPPQGDAPLSAARAKAGPNLLLWGGIPQDFLLPTHTDAEFRSVVGDAVHQVHADGRAILGVADRVPVDADLGRLRAIPEIVEAARQGQ
jgi:Uroporphyrinogen decarboxylase (URO-D)